MLCDGPSSVDANHLLNVQNAMMRSDQKFFQKTASATESVSDGSVPVRGYGFDRSSSCHLSLDAYI